MVRREKLEIIRDILELCKVPTRITRIVYQCNMNFNNIKRYLEWCFLYGWLTIDGRFYETTSLGIEYVDLITPTVESLETLLI